VDRRAAGAGAYVVNVGDMLEILTNGAFVATSHRVRKVSAERYSFPLFFCLDHDTRIEPLPRFVSPENPARASLVAGEHLYAQTMQTFTYLKERLAQGQIALPERRARCPRSGRRPATRLYPPDFPNMFQP
jgi:isopenicillin N synthase-like dioxygenase